MKLVDRWVWILFFVGMGTAVACQSVPEDEVATPLVVTTIADVKVTETSVPTQMITLIQTPTPTPTPTTTVTMMG